MWATILIPRECAWTQVDVGIPWTKFAEIGKSPLMLKNALAAQNESS
jgi:hypothetical protein